MPKLARIVLSIALIFCSPISNAESSMNKCTDGKRITYTNEPCGKIGLNSAGPIKNAVTVLPVTTKLLKDPTEKTGKKHVNDNDVSRNKAPTDESSGADASSATTIKPINPLVNKMLNW